jgi:Spy/CpxP family protein refolding chaperone
MHRDGGCHPHAIMMKPLMKLVVVLAVVLAGLVSVEAKPQRQGRRQAAPDASTPAEPPGVAPAEIQRLFDAYALVQAQEQLNISDEKYSQFLARFKALQDIRRKSLQEHTRIVLELNRLVNTQGDESQMKDRIKALEDADTRSRTDIQKAYEAIDQVLDVRQQAKFRVFEELMERRKLELVTRARQANRAARPQP